MSDPRALVDAYEELTNLGGQGMAPKTFAALRAVLELHQRRNATWAVCDVCYLDTGEPEDWPCETVQAVTTALEAT